MSFRPETPFDNIESGQEFVELLSEAINESRRDVDADIALAGNGHSDRYKQALQLVSSNLGKLSQHMITSRRILKNLRTLRRLLLEERRPDKYRVDSNGEGENYWGRSLLFDYLILGKIVL